MAQTLKDIFLDCLNPKVDSVVLSRMYHDLLTMSFPDELVTFEPKQSSARFFTAIEQFLDPGRLQKILDSLQCLQTNVDSTDFDKIVSGDKFRILNNFQSNTLRDILHCLEQVSQKRLELIAFFDNMSRFISQRSSFDLFDTADFQKKINNDVRFLYPMSQDFETTLKCFQQICLFLSDEIVCDYYEQVRKFVNNGNDDQIQRILTNLSNDLNNDNLTFVKNNIGMFYRKFELNKLLNREVQEKFQAISEECRQIQEPFVQFHTLWIIQLQAFFTKLCKYAFTDQEVSQLNWTTVFNELYSKLIDTIENICKEVQNATSDQMLQDFRITFPKHAEMIEKLVRLQYISIRRFANHIVSIVNDWKKAQQFLKNFIDETNFKFTVDEKVVIVPIELFFTIQSNMEDIPECVDKTVIIDAQKRLIDFAFYLLAWNAHFERPDNFKQNLNNYHKVANDAAKAGLQSAVQTFYKHSQFTFTKFLTEVKTKSIGNLERQRFEQIGKHPNVMYDTSIDDIDDEEFNYLSKSKTIDQNVSTCLTFFQENKDKSVNYDRLKSTFSYIFDAFDMFKPLNEYENSRAAFRNLLESLINFNSDPFKSFIDETFFNEIDELVLFNEELKDKQLIKSIFNWRQRMIETQNYVILFYFFISNIYRFNILTHTYSENMFDVVFERSANAIIKSERLATRIDGVIELTGDVRSQIFEKVDEFARMLQPKVIEKRGLTEHDVVPNKRPIKCNSVDDAYFALETLRKNHKINIDQDMANLQNMSGIHATLKFYLIPLTDHTTKSVFELDILKIPILNQDVDLQRLVAFLNHYARNPLEYTFVNITNDFITNFNTQILELTAFFSRITNNTQYANQWDASVKILKTPMYSVLNNWTSLKQVRPKIDNLESDILQTFEGSTELKQQIQFVNIIDKLDFSNTVFEPIQSFLNIVFVKLPWNILYYDAQKVEFVPLSIGQFTAQNAQNENTTNALIECLRSYSNEIENNRPVKIVASPLWKSKKGFSLQLLTQIAQSE